MCDGKADIHHAPRATRGLFDTQRHGHTCARRATQSEDVPFGGCSKLEAYTDELNISIIRVRHHMCLVVADRRAYERLRARWQWGVNGPTARRYWHGPRTWPRF